MLKAPCRSVQPIILSVEKPKASNGPGSITQQVSDQIQTRTIVVLTPKALAAACRRYLSSPRITQGVQLCFLFSWPPQAACGILVP